MPKIWKFRKKNEEKSIFFNILKNNIKKVFFNILKYCRIKIIVEPKIEYDDQN